MLQKAKAWARRQDWKALSTSPIGIALIAGALWSLSHRTGLMSMIEGNQDDEHEHKSTWHLRESGLLSAVIFTCLYIQNRYNNNARPMLPDFDEPPKGSRWMIVPENASIMLPGQEMAQPPATVDAYDSRFLKGPPPF